MAFATTSPVRPGLSYAQARAPYRSHNLQSEPDTRESQSETLRPRYGARYEGRYEPLLLVEL